MTESIEVTYTFSPSNKTQVVIATDDLTRGDKVSLEIIIYCTV